MCARKMISTLLRFILLPILIGAVMYSVVHVQMLIISKLIKVEITRQSRARLCISAFIISSIAALILMGVNEYFRLHLNNGGI